MFLNYGITDPGSLQGPEIQIAALVLDRMSHLWIESGTFYSNIEEK